MYYNRFRYYAPEEGIYISQDPIGLFGGTKVYGYVNDSTSSTDPFGLARRGNCATRLHMDQVRDQFLAGNPTTTHLAGGRDKCHICANTVPLSDVWRTFQ
ncbi:hypothetical protein G6M26_30705 [Agrobacterium tumefaciens]|nr:hypothetical protein [Agrobacterium tumefaciens]NTE22922.1 hypothetical protein [Agrobacterium tumefaciens]